MEVGHGSNDCFQQEYEQQKAGILQSVQQTVYYKLALVFLLYLSNKSV